MQPTTMLPKLTEATQTISFSEGDGVSSGEVYATDVVVTTNAGNHDHGSSKVTLKNLVIYNWEPKYYPGQLLAIHCSGKYFAYSIKAPNSVNPGTWSGMVRVVYNADPSSDTRALIKGMKGEVQDLSFAHIQKEVVLACIDDQGNFYVHEIDVTDAGLRCTLLAEIREDTGIGGTAHRVVWCPYIPDEDDEAPNEDVARLLLTTHSNIVRMWYMGAVSARVAGGGGSARALVAAGGAGGALAAAEHAAPVLDAAFSPDGTALATASADGYVMFFQVYMHNESSPRCLHKWQPHGGKPLSCLFFLDNHKNYNTDVQFWKFAVTGAENNTTIKIWSCKSWNCLQTIRFTPGTPGAESLGLKAQLDSSAKYLLLSDFKARSLYVLNMERDSDDTVACCRSISEFLLPYSVLSFCIVDVEEQLVKCESSCDDPFHRNGSSGDVGEPPDDFEMHHEEGVCVSGGGSRRVVLRLYIVQPKALQEGRLAYCPPMPHSTLMHGLSDLTLEDSPEEAAPALASTILQQQSQQLKNLLMRTQTQPGSLIGQRPESPSMAPQLNLMTPDAFSSPGKREEDDPPLSATPDVTGKPRTSTSGVNEEVGECAGKLTSGGSSPSREVQQIMAHNEPYYKDNEEEEEGSQSPVVESVSAEANGELFPAPDVFNTPDVFSPPEPKLTITNTETTWPEISLPQISEASMRAASAAQAGQLSSSLSSSRGGERSAERSGDRSAERSGDRSAERSGERSAERSGERAPSAEPLASLSPLDRQRLEQLDQKLDKLTELVSGTMREVRGLRGAVCGRSLVDEALHAHAQRTTQALESALADGWERWARVGETASSRAAQAAGLGAARALEPLAAALQHELAAKLTATDHLLRDNIEKLANSKTLMERLSTSIASSLSTMVRDSFREALTESVVPVMEKAHAQIFRQVNQAFQNGTKEFAAHTEAAARAAAERGGAAATASLRAALERHAEALAAAPPPHHLLTATIRDATHSVLEKEMSWWREQARSVAAHMSRAHSPATPHAHSAIDRQMQVAQVQSLMGAGDVNGAFQAALSASDLALVMCACRAADPQHVFGPPCLLKQHVLLSLVQQLAADMTRDTHLKHRYLEEAVMNLDTSNPVTREHLPGVVRELQKQVMGFLTAHPQHALARQFRMLLMATDSLAKAAA